MTDCRSLVIPGEVTIVELPVENDVDPEDVHRAQKLAGSLIWLGLDRILPTRNLEFLRWQLRHQREHF